MPMISFHCPMCHTTLKTANPDAVGRMFRCPKCSERFPMPGAEERETLSQRFRPVPAPPPIPPPSEVVEAGTPATPSRRRVLITAASLSGLAALLGVGTATYYAWDHLTAPKRNTGDGEEDSLSLIPADSDVVMRIKAGALAAADATLANPLEQHVRSLGASRLFYDPAGAIGVEPTDLFDELTYGIRLPRERSPGEGYYTLVIRSRVPFSQSRVARSFRATPREMFNKTYFQLDGEMFHGLFMPSDRTIVLTRAPTRHVAALVQGDGRQRSLPPDLEPLLRRCDRGDFWAMLAFTPAISDGIRSRMEAIPWSPRSWQPLLKELPEARAAGFWTKAGEGQVQLRAGLLCANHETAERIANSAESVLAAVRIGGETVQEALERSFISLLRSSVRLFLRDGSCEAQESIAVLASKGDVVELHPILRDLPQHLIRLRGQMFMPHGPMPMQPDVLVPGPEIDTR